jgi:hypothetical protein
VTHTEVRDSALECDGRKRRRRFDRIAICLEPTNLHRTAKIAAVVGCVLTLINEGDVVIAGHATAQTGLKIALNFCVPFIVSNLGLLAGHRDQA